MVVDQQLLQIHLVLGRGRAGPDADREEAIEPVLHARLQLDPQRHPDLDGGIEVHHPAQLVRHHQLAVLDAELLARPGPRVRPDSQ
jgi:hypothetical protein